MQPWRDISEAPKDGTEVLVSYYNDVLCARFFGLAYPDHYEDEGEGVTATHFMFLPDPPNTEG